MFGYWSIILWLIQPGLGAICPQGRLLRHLCSQGCSRHGKQFGFEAKQFAKNVSCHDSLMIMTMMMMTMMMMMKMKMNNTV